MFVVKPGDMDFTLGGEAQLEYMSQQPQYLMDVDNTTYKLHK